MDDKLNRAAARKSALKELLEGAGMAALGALMWMLGGDFTFVEGVTTRSEGRTPDVPDGRGRGADYHRRGVPGAGADPSGAAGQGRQKRGLNPVPPP